MPYSNFKKVSEVVERFNLTLKSENFIPVLPPISVSTFLEMQLEQAEKLQYSNEKERSERLLTPVLGELSRLNDYNLTIYSGRNLDVDAANDLNGECDFLLSTEKSFIDELSRPIFAIVEAKEQDLKFGLAQCSAQVVGVKRFNEQGNYDLNCYYGCSTTGLEWRFFKLENDILTINQQRFYLTNLGQLLSVLQYMVETSPNPSKGGQG
jgi:hypothetical protein